MSILTVPRLGAMSDAGTTSKRSVASSPASSKSSHTTTSSQSITQEAYGRLLQHVASLTAELDSKTDDLNHAENKLRQAAEMGNSLLLQLTQQR